MRRDWRRTDEVPSVRPVFVDEFGMYFARVERLVFEKAIFSLPAREVVEGLDDNYVGTVVRPVGGLVGTVDTAI